MLKTADRYSRKLANLHKIAPSPARFYRKASGPVFASLVRRWNNSRWSDPALVSPAGVKRVGVSCWCPVRLSLVGAAEAVDLSVLYGRYHLLANPMVAEVAADPSVRYWKNRDGAW